MSEQVSVPTTTRRPPPSPPPHGSVRASVAWLVGERVATTLVVFASNILVIRYLGAEGFGHLALFQIFLALLTLGTDLGLRRVFLSLGRARALTLVSAATWRIKAVLALLLGAALAGAVLGQQAAPDYLLLLGVVLAAPLDVHLYRFEAGLRNGLLARIRVGLALAMALARVLLCWGGQDLTLIAATYVAPPVLLNLIVAALGRSSLRERSATAAKLSRARLRTVQRHVLRRALWGFGAVLILQLGLRADQLLLGHLAGPQALGWYASAYKFVEQIGMLAMMLNGILLPALSRRGEAETRALLQSIYFATLVASLLAAAVLGGAAGLIVDTAYGPAFAPAGEVLAILALAIPGITLSLTGTLYYSLTGADAQLMLRAAAGLAIALAASLLLIPRYGAVGAAWAVVISQTLLAFGVDAMTPATRANNALKWQALAGLFSPENYRRLASQARRPRAAIEEVKA